MGKQKEAGKPEIKHEHNHDELAYEYNMLMQQLQQLQQTFSTMQRHKEELRRLELTIDDISKLEGKNKTLIPLGSGIYVNGEIDEQDSAYMNVGASVVVKKSFSDAIDVIRKQLAEVEGFMIQVENNLQQIVARMREIQGHLAEHQH